MCTVVLTREATAPEEYFPREIVRLLDFALNERRFWLPIFQFVKQSQRGDDEGHRRSLFDGICELHGLLDIEWDRLRDRAFRLLSDVYGLECKSDPRSLVAEYLAYRILDQIFPSEVVIQSALRWQCEGRTKRIIDSACTFDAAVLSNMEFIGYECKVTLDKFLRLRAGRFARKTSRKLEFMSVTRDWLLKRKVFAEVALVSLDGLWATQIFRETLRSMGCEDIEVVSLDEAERRLTQLVS